jgi:hypothetical protein
MSDSKENDAKAKFRDALEKKKSNSSIQKRQNLGGSKVSGGQTGGSTPKMFRRKSGSA